MTERLRGLASLAGLALLKLGARLVGWSNRFPLDQHPASEPEIYQEPDPPPLLSEDGFEMIMPRRSRRPSEDETPASPLRGSPASRRRRT